MVVMRKRQCMEGLQLSNCLLTAKKEFPQSGLEAAGMRDEWRKDKRSRAKTEKCRQGFCRAAGSGEPRGRWVARRELL